MRKADASEAEAIAHSSGICLIFRQSEPRPDGQVVRSARGKGRVVNTGFGQFPFRRKHHPVALQLDLAEPPKDRLAQQADAQPADHHAFDIAE